MPVGTILSYNGSLSKIPNRWHLCDGTNGTPNLIGKFLEGTITDAGIFKKAGLPNIKGTILGGDQTNHATGAFSTKGISPSIFATAENGSPHHYVYNFRASDYNPIYSDDCTTVQPSSYTVYYIMKIR